MNYEDGPKDESIQYKQGVLVNFLSVFKFVVSRLFENIFLGESLDQQT